jgi:PAS domain S-box-containing protein
MSAQDNKALAGFEQVLHEREKLLRKLLQNFPNGSVNVFDKDLRYLLAEGKGLEQVGLSTEQLAGKTLSDLFSKEDVDYVRPYYLKAFEGEAVSFELWLGGQCYSINAAPLQDNNDTIYAIIAVAQNITERKRAEEALRESEELFLLLLQSTDQGIYGIDVEGKCTFINRSGAEMPGYTPEEIVGKNMHTLAHHSHRDGTRYPETSCPIFQAFQGKQGTRIENEVFWRKNGTCFPVEYSSHPILREGRITGAVITFLDITERKELEQRKDDFIAIASHELKTPITSLKGFIQLLRKRLEKQVIKEPLAYLSPMEAQINKLTKLTADLLDVTKIQSGRLVLAHELVDVDAVVRESVATVQQISPHHTIVVTGASDAKIVGDRDRLEQVFVNLSSNAVKYSPEAEKVDVQIATARDRVVVSVRDYGIGIPHEYQSNIFDRFYRVPSSHDQGFPGLGMGLYISQDIIQRHGGDIWVESTGGKGTTFFVALPLIKQEQNERGSI